MKIKHLLIAGAAAGLMLCAPMQVTAAGSVEDVYAAMRDIGLSEAMVQQAKNMYQTVPHDNDGMEIEGHYATYDVWAEYVYIYEDQIKEKINSEFQVSTQATSATTAKTTSAQGGSSVSSTTSTTAATSSRTAAERKEFINMTLDEKKAYVASLPPEEQAEFLQNLSTSERNSIIKQLDTESQAEIAQSFIDLARQLGMNISVDKIGGGIDYSVRDGDGNLIDSSAIGTKVDDTGWDLTIPVLGSCAAILLALAGTVYTAKKTDKREEAAANG